MERRLGEVEWSPTEQSAKAEEYQKAAFEKEKVIKTLEGEVESQVISRSAVDDSFHSRIFIICFV